MSKDNETNIIDFRAKGIEPDICYKPTTKKQQEKNREVLDVWNRLRCICFGMGTGVILTTLSFLSSVPTVEAVFVLFVGFMSIVTFYMTKEKEEEDDD